VPTGRGDLSVQETTDSCPRKINSLLYLTIPHLLTQIAPLGRGLIMGKHLTLYLNNIHLTKQLITVKKIKRKDIFTEDSKMKKLIFISMIAVAAMGMIGCGEDDGTKADLRWNNESGGGVYDVKWVSSGTVNQSWSGDLTDNNTDTDVSDFKGITSLTGQGECLDVDDRTTGSEGTPYDISIDGALSHTVAENATETLNISGISAK